MGIFISIDIGNWGTKMSRVIELVSGRAGTWTKAAWLRSPWVESQRRGVSGELSRDASLGGQTGSQRRKWLRVNSRVDLVKELRLLPGGVWEARWELCTSTARHAARGEWVWGGWQQELTQLAGGVGAVEPRRGDKCRRVEAGSFGMVGDRLGDRKGGV